MGSRSAVLRHLQVFGGVSWFSSVVGIWGQQLDWCIFKMAAKAHSKGQKLKLEMKKKLL